MIYAFIFFIILLIILFIPIYINIDLQRKNNNDKAKFKIFLLNGIVKFDMEIPFLDIITKNNKPAVELRNKFEAGEKESDVSKEKKIISLGKIFDQIKETLRYNQVIIAITKSIIKRIKIIKLVWETKIGFHNAAVTAVLSGGIWSVKNVISSFIVYKKEAKKFHLNVIPCFNENIFETHFDCIIKLKIVYIIIAGLHGLKVKVKGGVNNE